MPKIHELPRIGKRTATALAVSLQEEWKQEIVVRPLKKCQPPHQGVDQFCSGSKAAGGTLLYREILLMSKILIIFSSVEMGITERWYHTG